MKNWYIHFNSAYNYYIYTNLIIVTSFNFVPKVKILYKVSEKENKNKAI